MAETPSGDPTTLDWDSCREFFRLRMLRHLGGDDRSPLEDLVQEACVRLLRAVRTQPVENLEGLMAVIAGRTWKDYLRRKTTHRKHFEGWDDEEREFADPGTLEDDAFGDLRDRIELVVQEVFDSHHRSECRDLAVRFFADHDWKAIGEELGVGYAAVRKRWSRCLELVRKVFRTDDRFADLIP